MPSVADKKLSPTELFLGAPLFFFNVAKISGGPVDDFIYYVVLNAYIVCQGFELKNQQ